MKSSTERSDRSGGALRRPLCPSGGYRDTASFQTARLIYDATWWFCEKFLDPRSRTVDQMVPAARSGRRKIAEARAMRAGAARMRRQLDQADPTDPPDPLEPADLASPTVPGTGGSWPCARPGPANTPASSSGAAPVTRTAKAHCPWIHLVRPI